MAVELRREGIGIMFVNVDTFKSGVRPLPAACTPARPAAGSSMAAN
jgi:hypothetical protein